MAREDIRRFWDTTLSDLSKVPLDASVEQVEPEGLIFEGAITTLTHYRATMSSFEGVRIRAWLSVPVGEAPDRGWPAVMTLPGYGGVMPVPAHIARYGYVTLALYPRGQGESAAEWSLDHSTKVTYNLTDRETYYYRGAYMDCVRGLDFLSSRPEVDPRRLGVWGRSQGGGLTLTTAALDERVRAAVAELPWPCSFPVGVGIADAPWSELTDYFAQHPGQTDQAMATLEYFDPLSLAERIDCPILVNAATDDEVHPYRTIAPVFEKIPPIKSLIVYPDMEHGGRNDFANHGLAWLDRYLR